MASVARHVSPVRLIGLAAAVLVVDQVSKHLVLRALPPGMSWPGADAPLGRYFSFTHVTNTGVALGMLQGHSEILALVAIAVVLVLLLYRQRHARKDWLLDGAIGLQVGGAMGNLVDRLTAGHVIDFVDLKFWPVFNVADAAISSGVVLLAWRMWREDRRRESAMPSLPPAGTSANAPGTAVTSANAPGTAGTSSNAPATAVTSANAPATAGTSPEPPGTAELAARGAPGPHAT